MAPALNNRMVQLFRSSRRSLCEESSRRRALLFLLLVLLLPPFTSPLPVIGSVIGALII